MAIDHVGITVPAAKLEGVVKFLSEALAHTGFKELVKLGPNMVLMGETKPYFLIQGVDGEVSEETLRKTHVAFSAERGFFISFF